MKKMLAVMFFAAMLLWGCGDKSPDGDISSVSDLSGEESAKAEESQVDPTEIFDFLSSEYYITARNEAMGNVYEYVYYFDDGIVVGTKTVSAFTDETLAEAYAEGLKKDNAPLVLINGNTVTAYYGDDYNAYYNGYSLEKMKFVLEHMGYEYSLEFDEEDFYADFSDVSE